MNKELMISDKVKKMTNEAEGALKEIFDKYDEICLKNTTKVLNAFINNNISTNDLYGTNGYGYNDVGREKIDKIYSEVLGAEDALVRGQFVSGTHALTVCLFANLRPGDMMLSITGTPYDTLHEVIGLRDNPSSLKSYGVNYKQVDLVNNEFDTDKIKEVLKKEKIKLIEIQRSKGYSNRKSITVDMIKKVIEEIRKVSKDVIIMVDNCYCEFVGDKTPTKVGADIMVGSLIKNLGGGIAPNGAYVAGKRELIDLVGERLTLPGEGREVGPTLGINKQILQGIFMSPPPCEKAKYPPTKGPTIQPNPLKDCERFIRRSAPSLFPNTVT